MNDRMKAVMHEALHGHLDHLLDHLLPLASDDGAQQILMAGRATVRTLSDLALVDDTEAEALLDRVHAAYRSHT